MITDLEFKGENNMEEHNESLNALSNYIEEIYETEGLKDLMEVVDLDIAYSPVLPHPLPADPAEFDGVPDPVSVRPLQGGDYLLIYNTTHPGQNTEQVSRSSLLVMRARYMKWRGYYANKLNTTGIAFYPDRQKVISWYFNGFFLKL